MSTVKKTCFVVMGFGEKVDFQTGRKLNLDAAYRAMVKPAVEEAGLICRRADEIVHSGNINVPMYREILTADVVVADLSTSNANAFYELGVRHALKPYTTIVIAEDNFKFPFDLAQIVIRQYRHLGEEVGYNEAMRFRKLLKDAIEEVLAKHPEPDSDSPVYTFIQGLKPPSPPKAGAAAGASAAAAAGASAADASASAQTHSVLMQQVDEAQKRGDFITAKALLSTVRGMMRGQDPSRPEDPYILRRLALVTYKSKIPTPQAALEEARALLEPLNPATSNDTETLGIWGGVHKRLWELTGDKRHLEEAVRAYKRGFYLRNDFYNGINLAFLGNVSAVALSRQSDAAPQSERAALRAAAVMFFVHAERVRREVLDICRAELDDEPLNDEQKYWVLATMAEALLGVGDEAAAQEKLREAHDLNPPQWMKDSTREQTDKLRSLLAESPLKYIRVDP